MTDQAQVNPFPGVHELKQQIDAAAAEMATRIQGNRSRNNGSEPLALLFSGQIHHSIPQLLLFNPAIGPTEKTIWLLMRALFTGNNRLAEAPRRSDLAALVPCTGPTVSKSRALLRLHRWITLCRRVRDVKGRNVGDIYMLHEEPLPIPETLILDCEFVAFLEDMAQNTRFAVPVRTLALEIQDEIQQNPDPRQVLVLEFLQNRMTGDRQDHRGKNFTPVDDSRSKILTLGKNGQNPGEQRKIEENHRGKNFTPVENGQGSGENPEISQNHRGKNFTPVPCSSSSSLYKYNNTAHARAKNGQAVCVSAASEKNLFEMSFPDWMEKFTSCFPWFRDYPDLPYIVDTLSLQWAYLEVFSRQLGELDQNSAKLVSYQLIAKSLAGNRRLSRPIDNYQGYLHSMIKKVRAQQFVLDEFGEELRLSVEFQYPLNRLGPPAGATLSKEGIPVIEPVFPPGTSTNRRIGKIEKIVEKTRT